MKHLFSKYLREIGILFSIAMPFTLFSCHTNLKDETGKAVVVKIAQPTENEIKLSLIADSLVYIPLETQNDLLIGQITKLSVSDNYLCVLDEITSNVFCFTHDGKFVRKIGSRGVGPGEYVEINDVTTYSQQVYLWDGNLRKIFIYDGESGELKQEVKTDYWAEYIHVIDDSWIALYGDYKNNTAYVENGKTPNVLFWNIRTGETHPASWIDSKMLQSSGIYGSLTVFTDCGSYLSTLDNCLYQMNSRPSLDKKIIFALEPPLADAFDNYKEKLLSTRIEAYEVAELIQGFPSWASVNETDKYLIFNYQIKSCQCMLIHNKETGNLIEGCSKGKLPIRNDIDNIDGISKLYFLSSHGNILYTSLPPYMEGLDKTSWGKYLKEDDNPIIVAIHMKKAIN